MSRITERTPSSGAGAAQEPGYRLLFEQTMHAMAVLSTDGIVVAANRALLALAGEPADTAPVAGHALWHGPWWRNPEGAEERLRALVVGAASGTAGRGEFDAVDATGRALILDLTVAPVLDAEQRVVQLVAEAIDVTEAKWAERALRISEAKFAGIVSIASDAIISIDESQAIVHFNLGAESIFGWKAEEILGQPLDTLIPARFHAAHREHVRSFGRSTVAARRMGERAEILGLRKDGTEFPADASISKLEVGGERIYTVVLRDVTDRKRAERGQEFLAQAGALLGSSLDYDTTLRSVVRLAVPTLADWAVLYVVRQPGDGGSADERRASELERLELVHADPAMEPLLDALNSYPLADMSAHPVFGVVASGEPLLLAETHDELLHAMTPDETHRDVFRRLGFRSLMIVPLVARGHTLGAIGFYAAARTFDAQDFGLARELAGLAALALDNARLYRTAQSAVQARDDVLAVVSHDLGNPLSAIRIGTKLVRRRLSEDESDALRQLDGIRQAAEQMERLINDLLDVKRLEAGQLTLQRRPQRPASLLTEVVEMIGSIAEERGQQLVCEADEGLAAVSIDRPRMLQVLQNLLGNAMKFTPPGGRIVLRAATHDGAVRISVSDTGPGIPEAHLPYIFDRFWQAKREGRLGLGLGLAIARGIVEAHGGRIWAESRVGAGTNVYFTLPFDDAATGST
jgi:PAS domain S-box-containing protein